MPRSRDLSAIQLNNPRQPAPPYGDNRVRTGDPLLAKQVLYQLSYVPKGTATSNGHLEHWPRLSLVGTGRWWAREDSNLRPHAYQACALTN